MGIETPNELSQPTLTRNRHAFTDIKGFRLLLHHAEFRCWVLSNGYQWSRNAFAQAGRINASWQASASRARIGPGKIGRVTQSALAPPNYGDDFVNVDRLD
jgi:hypothetical protein